MFGGGMRKYLKISNIDLDLTNQAAIRDYPKMMRLIWYIQKVEPDTRNPSCGWEPGPETQVPKGETRDPTHPGPIS